MKYTNNKRKQTQIFEITQSIAEDLFFECNRLFFDNNLPNINIEIINDSTVNGNFKYNVDLEKNTIDNFTIQISNTKPRNKSSYISTMVHEIIHYIVVSSINESTIKEANWYLSNGNEDKFNELMYYDKYAHTNQWAAKAEHINKLYGIKINRG